MCKRMWGHSVVVIAATMAAHVGVETAHASGLDTSFGGDGVVITAGPVDYPRVRPYRVLETSGGIVVSAAATYSLPDGNQVDDLLLARYHADGTLDANFGSGGLTTLAHHPIRNPTGLALQGDKILVAAQEEGTNALLVARYTRHGNLDTVTAALTAPAGAGTKVLHVDSVEGFQVGDTLTINAGETNVEHAVIAALGSSTITVAAALASPHAVDEIVNHGFGPSDTGVSAVPMDSACGCFIAVLSDDRIVVSDYSFEDNAPFLVRLSANGVIDHSFGNAGVARTSFTNSFPYSMELDGDTFLIGTEFYDSNSEKNRFAVIRLSAGGLPVVSFGNRGIAVGPSNLDYRSIVGAVVQPGTGGKIVIGGEVVNGTNEHGDDCTDFFAGRFTSSGALDATFGNGGVAITDIGACSDQASTIAAQGNGKIIVGGDLDPNEGDLSDDDLSFVRYRPNGAIDESFGTSGTLITALPPEDDSYPTLMVQSDGAIVAAAQTDNCASDVCLLVARYEGDNSEVCSVESGSSRGIGRASSECCVNLRDISPPIYVARKTGRTLDASLNTIPVACGLDRDCPLANFSNSEVLEVDVKALESEARESTKNVGQEVKLQADVSFDRSRLKLKTLRWSVEGKTIDSYTDISGYLKGKRDALNFTPSPIRNPWQPTTDPNVDGGDAIRFFWKDVGSYDVEVEAVVEDVQGQKFVCNRKREFTVERNRTDPDRQPEDFFTSCCSEPDQHERVRFEHETWHNQSDMATPHPGDDWLNFHRAVVRVFQQWRDFFGYPELGFYDGTGPIPDSENGYTLQDVSRGNTLARCPAPSDPRMPSPPLQANCPLPGWFTDSGDGSARPPQAGIDIGKSILVDGAWELDPRCFKAADNDGDRCWPANENYDDTAPQISCGPPASLTGPLAGIPVKFKPGGGSVFRDLVDVGQAKLSDFRDDNVELGCIITKTWHGEIHVRVNGAMRKTSTSPKDPVFYRMHNRLSGLGDNGLSAGRTAGSERSMYDSWQAAKSSGPPGLILRFPYPEYPLAALPTVTVEFWEAVTGVTADDLTVDGSRATAVSGTGRGPYTFSGFRAPVPPHPAVGPVGHEAPGATVMVAVELKPGGITDMSGMPYAGDTWTYPIEADRDSDEVPDTIDNCPSVANPLQENSDVYGVHDEPPAIVNAERGHANRHPRIFPGDALGDACDDDDDDDGVRDVLEIQLGSDPKSRTILPNPAILPGDLDGDGVANSLDGCFTDPRKTRPGLCGCEAADVDSDLDGTFDCFDTCPDDRNKRDPGDCGCGFVDMGPDGFGGFTCVLAPVPGCAGDCDDSGAVTVDEILKLVSAALGATSASTCTAGDTSMDGNITVDEIITAVGRALMGCASRS